MGHKVDNDIDVLGVCLRNIYDGFGPFKSSASRILLMHQLGKAGANKLAEFDPDAWYPLQRFLDALAAIAKEAGETVLYNAGRAVPTNVVWPPQVTDIHSALESVNVAYHMNHGRRGAPLFNAATGRMLEGIGHYRTKRTGEFVQMVCENPYPCEFDRGLVAAIAKQFKLKARTYHVEGEGCRNKGSAACTYEVTW